MQGIGDYIHPCSHELLTDMSVLFHMSTFFLCILNLTEFQVFITDMQLFIKCYY